MTQMRELVPRGKFIAIERDLSEDLFMNELYNGGRAYAFDLEDESPQDIVGNVGQGSPDLIICRHPAYRRDMIRNIAQWAKVLSANGRMLVTNYHEREVSMLKEELDSLNIFDRSEGQYYDGRAHKIWLPPYLFQEDAFYTSIQARSGS